MSEYKRPLNKTPKNYKSSSRYHITAVSAKAETVSLTITIVELNLYSNQISRASKNSNSRHRLKGPEYQPRVLFPLASYKIYYLYLGEREHRKDTSAYFITCSLSPFHKDNIFQKWRIPSFPDRGPLSYGFTGQDYFSPACLQSQKILLLSLLLKRVPQHRCMHLFLSCIRQMMLQGFWFSPLLQNVQRSGGSGGKLSVTLRYLKEASKLKVQTEGVPPY